MIDLSDVTFVKRIVVGSNNPTDLQNNERIEEAMALLNRCLSSHPKGKIVGIEKSFSLLQVGEHQVVLQWSAVEHRGVAVLHQPGRGGAARGADAQREGPVAAALHLPHQTGDGLQHGLRGFVESGLGSFDAFALVVAADGHSLGIFFERVDGVGDAAGVAGERFGSSGDFLAGAGHKAYAPFGAGFLYGPRKVFDAAEPYLPGGGNAVRVTEESVEFLPSPDRHHGGTPNIAGVVGMTSSLRFLKKIGMDAIRRHEVELTRRALEGMQKLGGVTIYGDPSPEARLGVISFNVDGVSELMTAAVLSEEGGVAVRNGRFCAHIYMDRLLRMHHAGRAEDMPTGAARASFGVYNDESDVDRFLEQLKKVRDRAWVGRYQIKGGAMMAEFASRCADHWMESA